MTDKAHARVRVGDVLTVPVGGPAGGRVRVVRVLAMAERRGPAPEARLLYEELSDLMSCNRGETPPYGAG